MALYIVVMVDFVLGEMSVLVMSSQEAELLYGNPNKRFRISQKHAEDRQAIDCHIAAK